MSRELLSHRDTVRGCPFVASGSSQPLGKSQEGAVNIREMIAVGSLVLTAIASCVLVLAIGLADGDAGLVLFGAFATAIWTPGSFVLLLKLDSSVRLARKRAHG